MISAEEFIAILEQKDLLDPDLVDDLRRRVEQSMAPVSAALLAKRLVDKGHLSRKLAQRLLDRAESEEAEETASVDEPVEEVAEIGNLGLAPLEEDDEEEVVEEVAELEMTEEEDWGLQELDDDIAKYESAGKAFDVIIDDQGNNDEEQLETAAKEIAKYHNFISIDKRNLAIVENEITNLPAEKTTESTDEDSPDDDDPDAGKTSEENSDEF